VDKKSKRKARGVAIFIAFLALATSLFILRKQGEDTPTINFKPTQNKYLALKWINKSKIEFSSDNITEAKAAIEAMIKRDSNKQIEKDTRSNYGIYIFSLPKDKKDEFANELARKGTIISRSEQVDTSLVYIDYETEQNRLNSYDKELTDLSMVRFPSETQIRRKEALHGLIAESTTKLEKLRDVDDVLVYVTAIQRQAGNTMVSKVKRFVLLFLAWLGFYFVGVVLVYYGTKLLMYLLTMLGIKGLGISGINYDKYASSYNYGGFKNYGERYQYGNNRKRKTKRVYKEKPSDTDKDSEESK
jgi:hypothetical protein